MKEHKDWLRWVGMIGLASTFIASNYEIKPMLAYSAVYFTYASFIYWWRNDMEEEVKNE